MHSEEVEKHVQTTMNLARPLGFNGTPPWVIVDKLVPDFVLVDDLQRLTEEARA